MPGSPPHIRLPVLLCEMSELDEAADFEVSDDDSKEGSDISESVSTRTARGARGSHFKNRGSACRDLRARDFEQDSQRPRSRPAAAPAQVPATTRTKRTVTTTTNPRRPPGGRQRQDTGHPRPRRRPGHPRHRPGHPRRRRRHPCRRPGHLRLRHPRPGRRLFVRWNSIAATTAATNVPTSRLLRQRQAAPRDASLPRLARGTVPTKIYLRGGPTSLPESFRRGLAGRPGGLYPRPWNAARCRR